MVISPQTSCDVLYRRQGYADVLLRLRADGSVADPPGHAEHRWRVADDGRFHFESASGEVTATLAPRNGCYQGVLLGRLYAELRAPPTPASRAVRRDGPMRYLLCIPYVNRMDLLERAVRSVEGAFGGHLALIDNSEGEDLRSASFAAPHELVVPPVPLSFAQTQNLMRKLAMRRDCDVLFFMHGDGEAAPGSARRVLALAESTWRTNPRFGVIFTHYDVLCAFNVATLRAVGPWDTAFTQHFADNDYYDRLEAAGYEKLESAIDVRHAEASATVNCDPGRRRVNELFFPVFDAYYRMKAAEREAAVREAAAR